MKRSLALLALAVTAVLAGCGGGDDEASAEAWADDVCTSAESWVDQLVEIATNVDLSAGAEGVQQQLDEAEEATQTFLDDVRETGAPDTQAGGEAQEEIEGLVERTQERIETLRDELEGASATEALDVLQQAVPEIEETGADVRDTLDRVEELDPAGELREGIEDTESCQELRERSGE